MIIYIASLLIGIAWGILSTCIMLRVYRWRKEMIDEYTPAYIKTIKYKIYAAIFLAFSFMNIFGFPIISGSIFEFIVEANSLKSPSWLLVWLALLLPVCGVQLYKIFTDELMLEVLGHEHTIS